jgi:L-malate glycosyltransferase
LFHRISFIVGGLNTGGAEKQLLYLLIALTNHGMEIQVLLLNLPNRFETQLTELNIPVIWVGKGNTFQKLSNIVNEIRQFRPDIIQASHFFCNIYAGLAGRILRIPSIGAVRGDFYHDLNGVRYLGRLASKLPTILLTNSDNARQNAIRSGLEGRRVFVLPNSIDINEFDILAESSEVSGLSGNEFKVITVARLIKVKKLEVFLKSVAIAKDHIPEMRAFIAGSGPEEQSLIEYAKRIGLSIGLPECPVVFLGNVTNVPALLSHSDIFLLTSESEGFPNAVIESMAARLPVVSTPAGEVKEIIQDGINGFLVPFDDPESISKKIILLSENPLLRRQMGIAARQSVENRFGFPSLEANVMSLYQEISSRVDSRSVKQTNQIQEKSKQA